MDILLVEMMVFLMAERLVVLLVCTWVDQTVDH
jgi:hypothetical protein